MVRTKRFCLEDHQGEYRKNNQCCYLLQYFQLDEAERSPMFLIPNPIGGYLEHIFKQRYAPTDQYYGNKPKLIEPLPF